MALDMYLSFDENKKIKGESKAENFVDQIEILAWSWGASQSATTHYGEGSGAGQANIQDLSVTKWVDAGSAGILQCCVAGEHIPVVVLTMCKAGGIDNKQKPFLKLTLTDAIITSYSTGGSGGEDRLTENISINFAKVKFETLKQDKKGVIAPSGTASYDIPAKKVS